jgi:hypothetical protein
MIYGTQADMSQFNANQQQQQQAQNLAAVGQYADISQAQSADQIARLNAMLDIGNDQWSIQQQQSLAPATLLGLYGDALNPSLIGATSGQVINSNEYSTAKKSGGLLNPIIGAAATIGSAAISERRVKRDIEQIGTLDDGLGVYNFRYIWDDDAAPLHTGVMVDEVEKARPWALGPVVDGIQTVDYAKLEEFA